MLSFEGLQALFASETVRASEGVVFYIDGRPAWKLHHGHMAGDDVDWLAEATARFVCACVRACVCVCVCACVCVCVCLFVCYSWLGGGKLLHASLAFSNHPFVNTPQGGKPVHSCERGRAGRRQPMKRLPPSRQKQAFFLLCPCDRRLPTGSKIKNENSNRKTTPL